MTQQIRTSRIPEVPPESQPLVVDPAMLLTPTDFAKRHGVVNSTLLYNMHQGRIHPILFGPDGQYLFIDLTKYDNFDFGRWPGRHVTPPPVVPKVPAPRIPVAPKALLSMTDYAKRKGVSLTTINKHIKKGLIRPTLLGPDRQYRFIDLDLYDDHVFRAWNHRQVIDPKQ